MRRWLDPIERKNIVKALGKNFRLLGTYPLLFYFDSIL